MKRPLITAMLALACLKGSGLRAGTDSALYLMAGLDAKVPSYQDANDYFNSNGQSGPQAYPGAVLHLGYKMHRWMTLELSGDFGRVIGHEVNIGTRQVTTRWALSTFSVMPAVSLTGRGYVNLLGLRVGLANLAGHVQDNAGGLQGSYDQDAQAYDLGVLVRYSRMVSGHFSLGVEAGYDLTVFNKITNTNGRGTYDPPHSPERNISNLGHNGAQTSLDFSGFHIALVLGLWSNSPAPADVKAIADTLQP